MNKNDAIIRIKELVALCNRYSDAYYNGQELVSDIEYDNLYCELINLEQKTGFIMSNSPTQIVGHEVCGELPKIMHAQPMLSLDKITTIEEIEKLIGDKTAVISLKEDGLSIRVHYDKNGDFKMAATRGDGTVASDITSNIACFTNLPLHIETNGHETIIDGEAICTFTNFERLNSELDEPYKHPRAVASGSVLLQDHREAKKRQLSFIAWKFTQGTDEVSYGKRLDKLKVMGFDVVPWQYVDKKYIKEQISMLQDSAKILSHPYDGIVVAIDDTSIWDILGATSHHPNHSKAYKFAQDAEETVITHFEFNVGKTGQITPIACFQPIILDNTEVTKASCHNISYCKNLNIGVGAKVKVIKAMQIIPQIVECVEPGDTFKPILHCPICGTKTQIVKDNESEVLMCTNDNCRGRLLGKLTYAVSKKAIDIKHLSEATLEVLINKGWLNSLADIYRLAEHRIEWEEVNGFGKSSVKKIIDAIESSRNITLDKFICALSIPTIGVNASKIISTRFGGDYHEWFACCKHFNFEELDGFGKIMNDNIKEYLNKHIHEMRDLAAEMNFILPEEYSISENPFVGKTICVTGKLNHFTRDSINEKIISLGAKTAGSVSKKTDYLITNESSGSSKYKKAVELNIPIITEEKFLNMIGE